MKKCKACNQDINEEASKCRHCNAWQGLRYYLTPTETVLALIVALISVSTMSYQTIKQLRKEHNSDINMLFLDRADTTVPLVISNSGGRPAVISTTAGLSMWMKSKDNKINKHILMLKLTDGSRDNLLIPAETSKQFYYYATKEQPFRDTYDLIANDFKNFFSVRKCIMTLTYYDFYGDKITEEHLIHKFRKTKYNPDDPKLTEDLQSASECFGKLPLTIRQKYDISGFKKNVENPSIKEIRQSNQKN